jgi:YgiT-type zinc finger domain-containing protein
VLSDEETLVTCPICRTGQTRPGHVTVTLRRGDTTIILKGVPADVCDNCEEYYLSEDITHRVPAAAEEAIARGAEVEILRFAAG